MKLLFHTLNRSEVDSVRIRLESNGIPVFVSNDYSSTMLGPVFSAKPYSVWVVLENQHHDAEMLLKNPEHLVAEPVDVALFYKEMAGQRSNAYIKIMLWGAGLVAMLFALLVIVVYVDNFIGS